MIDLVSYQASVAYVRLSQSALCLATLVCANEPRIESNGAVLDLILMNFKSNIKKIVLIFCCAVHNSKAFLLLQAAQQNRKIKEL